GGGAEPLGRGGGGTLEAGQGRGGGAIGGRRGGGRTGRGRVDRPGAGGGEQPCPPRLLISAERPQAADDLKPGLRRDVLLGTRRDHPQVAQQGRVGIPP